MFNHPFGKQFYLPVSFEIGLSNEFTLFPTFAIALSVSAYGLYSEAWYEF